MGRLAGEGGPQRRAEYGAAPADATLCHSTGHDSGENYRASVYLGLSLSKRGSGRERTTGSPHFPF